MKLHLGKTELMTGMRDGATTDDYRRAVDGKGEFGSLGYEWSDKPHRLIYDLCNEIDRLNILLKRMSKEGCGG